MTHAIVTKPGEVIGYGPGVTHTKSGKPIFRTAVEPCELVPAFGEIDHWYHVTGRAVASRRRKPTA